MVKKQQALAEANNLTKVGLAELIAAGYVAKTAKVKILAQGTLTAKLEVEAHAFSKTAEEAIVALGGTVVKL